MAKPGVGGSRTTRERTGAITGSYIEPGAPMPLWLRNPKEAMKLGLLPTRPPTPNFPRASS